MALETADLEALGKFISQEVSKAVGDLETKLTENPPAPAAADPRIRPPEMQGTTDAANAVTEDSPKYYVHLANGDVVTSADSASTHLDIDGESVAVIGRYKVGG
jgi:hypothetical protein